MDLAIQIALLLFGVGVSIFLLVKKKYFLAVALVVITILAQQWPRLTRLQLSPTSLKLELSEKIGAENAKRLQSRIDAALIDYERRTGRTIPASTRQYVLDVVAEGFRYRDDELKKRYGIDINEPDGTERAIDRSIESLDKILEEAKPTDNDEVTISKFVEPIKDNWCQVWPFCG